MYFLLRTHFGPKESSTQSIFILVLYQIKGNLPNKGHGKPFWSSGGRLGTHPNLHEPPVPNLLLFVDPSQRSHMSGSCSVIVPGLLMECNITQNLGCLFKQRGTHQGHKVTSRFPPARRSCGESRRIVFGMLSYPTQ